MTREYEHDLASKRYDRLHKSTPQPGLTYEQPLIHDLLPGTLFNRIEELYRINGGSANPTQTFRIKDIRSTYPEQEIIEKPSIIDGQGNNDESNYVGVPFSGRSLQARARMHRGEFDDLVICLQRTGRNAFSLTAFYSGAYELSTLDDKKEWQEKYGVVPFTATDIQANGTLTYDATSDTVTYRHLRSDQAAGDPFEHERALNNNMRKAGALLRTLPIILDKAVPLETDLSRPKNIFEDPDDDEQQSHPEEDSADPLEKFRKLKEEFDTEKFDENFTF